MDILFTQEQARVPVTVVHLKGSFDSASYAEFEKRVKAEIDGGAHQILLDLRDVPYMSSAGARALNNTFNWLEASNPDQKAMREGLRTGSYKSPHLKLLHPTPRVLEVLKMIGLDMYLDIFHDPKQALASF